MVEAIKAGDMTTVRWRLTQKAHDRGYGIRADQQDFTPPDPNAEAHRMKAIAFFSKVIEERIRAGLPPIFAQPAAARAPMVLEITDRSGKPR